MKEMWNGIKKHGWKFGVGAAAVAGLLYLCMRSTKEEATGEDDIIETEFDDALDPIGDLPGEDG